MYFAVRLDGEWTVLDVRLGQYITGFVSLEDANAAAHQMSGHS